ncbi:hypothetical protein [Chitinophaga flava]|uniref:Uncharacterized protein n=1 Tax=Chitinophaga flava TaxID=2259036 RepID=A0A365Y0Y0_9BACT|nr:hypothetical protein [Chitinophaga flava]RBL92282.1 hypothetical protein DF182_06740 [Chitinophaga flava]
MPHTIQSASEKYQKYLLQIIFKGHTYYTVSGADLTDNDTDKLLVDHQQQLVLALTISDLITTIEYEEYFDSHRLRKWAKVLSDTSSHYATFNLDDLFIDKLDEDNDEHLFSLYALLGLIRDYALQADDEYLMQLLDNPAIIDLLDELADYFWWKGQRSLQIKGNKELIGGLINQMYIRINDRITILYA